MVRKRPFFGKEFLSFLQKRNQRFGTQMHQKIWSKLKPHHEHRFLMVFVLKSQDITVRKGNIFTELEPKKTGDFSCAKGEPGISVFSFVQILCRLSRDIMCQIIESECVVVFAVPQSAIVFFMSFACQYRASALKGHWVYSSEPPTPWIQLAQGSKHKGKIPLHPVSGFGSSGVE